MLGRLSRVGPYSTVAVSAALAVAALVAVPVLAAPGPELRCEDSESALADPTTFELEASPASSGDEDLDNHLLKSDARSAARGAFAGEKSVDVGDDSELEAENEDSPSDGGLHSASESKVLPYKRQMYRRDI